MHNAILLLGPTGAGKTPLGMHLQREGIRGIRFVHFDFGHTLRTLAATAAPVSGLSPADGGYIGKVLQEGALLENETFYIAAALLRDFITKNAITGSDIIVLNGLPRHRGQAEDIAAIVAVNMVVFLDCPVAVARERIRTNTGSDRCGRVDDAPDAIEKKFARFEARTVPLLDHYRVRNIPVIRLPITAATIPEEMLRLLAQKEVFRR